MLIAADAGKDRKVATEVTKLEGGETAFLASGMYDVVVRLRGKTAEHTLALVYDRIRSLPGVKSSHTMFALET